MGGFIGGKVGKVGLRRPQSVHTKGAPNVDWAACWTSGSGDTGLSPCLNLESDAVVSSPSLTEWPRAGFQQDFPSDCGNSPFRLLCGEEAGFPPDLPIHWSLQVVEKPPGKVLVLVCQGKGRGGEGQSRA